VTTHLTSYIIPILLKRYTSAIRQKITRQYSKQYYCCCLGIEIIFHAMEPAEWLSSLLYYTWQGKHSRF